MMWMRKTGVISNMKWWQRILLNTVVFLVLANFLDGFFVDDWTTAVVAAVVLSILNALVKPVISLFSLPVTLITLGLFSFVINGLMIWMTSSFVTGFIVRSFGQAILVSLILSLVNSLVSNDV